ncbi:MAG TPA: hypothetical protein VFS21_27585 [Roseiflexaceae bacterium]|nr:hypothetical protein [Roseiflexaceae bacterium]
MVSLRNITPLIARTLVALILLVGLALAPSAAVQAQSVSAVVCNGSGLRVVSDNAAVWRTVDADGTGKDKLYTMHQGGIFYCFTKIQTSDGTTWMFGGRNDSPAGWMKQCKVVRQC